DLEPERPATHFAEATDARAAREVRLLGRGEIEEAQRQRPGAVGDAAQQLPAPTIDDFRELDFTFDDHAHAVAHAADGRDLRAILVTRRQYEQQILDLGDPELRELVGERRTDAAQRGHRPLFGNDARRRVHPLTPGSGCTRSR